MTNREKFEAWAVSDESWCAGIERHGDSYKAVATAASWVAYQAGIRSAATAAPAQPEGQTDEPVAWLRSDGSDACTNGRKLLGLTSLGEGGALMAKLFDQPLYLRPCRSAGAAAPASSTSSGEAPELIQQAPVLSQAAAPAEGAAWREVLEKAAKAIEALRDDHCAGTKQSPNKQDWCEPDDVACEFVVAWNEAAAAVRALATPTSPTPAQEGKT